MYYYTVGNQQSIKDDYIVPLTIGAIIGTVSYLSSALFTPSVVGKRKKTKILIATALADTLVSGIGSVAVTAVSKWHRGVLTGGTRDWLTTRSVSMMFLGALLISVIRPALDRLLLKVYTNKKSGVRPALLFPLKSSILDIAEKEDIIKEAKKLAKKGHKKLLKIVGEN